MAVASWRSFAAALLAVTACRPGDPPGDARYRDAAGDIVAWLGTLERTGPVTVWPVSVEASRQFDPSLGTGAAGTALFHLAFARATGDDTALTTALRAGRFLADTLPTLLLAADTARNAASLYAGLSGVAFALTELAGAGDDPVLRSAGLQALERIHELALEAPGGVEWSPYNDVLFGAAGTGLFLLYAAREMSHPASLTLATSLGETLMARAEVAGQGLTWRLRRDRDIYLPNFSHGAAGIGYFLAHLAQATGQRRFLDGALGAARYLEGIARRNEGGILLPYSVPNGQFDYDWDIGWAHGPAGSARLFLQLHRQTGDAHWLDLARASAAGLRASGLPGPPMAPFKDEPFRIDQRFGTAGVAEFLLDLSDATGDSTYLVLARQVVDTILARSTVDATGRRWVLPQYGFMDEPGLPATFTGYFYGAAGFGLALLRLDGALRGSPWGPALPDDLPRRDP